MKFKFGIKQIVLSVVAVLLVAIMIAGNIILNTYSSLIHRALAGGDSGGGDQGGAHDGESAFEYASRISEEAAEDSIVLLKNDEVDGKPYLPLSETTKFCIFGWGATDQGFLLSGGGSGGTNTNKDTENVVRTTLLGAFREAHIEYYTDLVDEYSKFSSDDADYRSTNAGATNAKDADKAAQNPGKEFYTDGLMNGAKNYSKEAIVVLSRWGNENGGDEELKHIGTYAGGSYLHLTADEETMLTKVQDYGFNVTVLLNVTNPIEMDFLDTYSCIKAVMFVGTLGQSGAKAIPNLLVGSKATFDDKGEVSDTVSISPSGRLSDTLANTWRDFAPSYNNVGVSGNVAYKEGIYVGYKWYETADEAGYYAKKGKTYSDIVRYPFGYGLSYTTFSQEITSFTLDGKPVGEGAEISESGTYSMTVKVKNTGNFPGREVVQLYYTPEYHEGGVEKASINLLAFAKTGVLQPAGAANGEDEQEVTLTFDAYDMACYDCYGLNDIGTTGYEIDKGAYEIKLMKNAHEEIENQTRTLNSAGFAIENDPFTGNEVKNLFTGDTAYANMPVDGSKGVSGGVTYLSRKNGFENYDQATTPVGTVTSQVNDSKKYDYTGYDTEEIRTEVSGYSYGVDGSLYITTLEDGSKPSSDDLEGQGGATLSVNQDLLQYLIADPDEGIWKMFLDQVTQRELGLLVANGLFNAYSVESVGKPHTEEKDGPSGFNDNTQTLNGGKLYPFYPTENLLGCSWDVDMMREVGRAQGKVGVQEKLAGWYAPGVNLHRSPYNSRNYEYFSEDGVLSGWLAAGIINGAKEENVYCYLKHFALAESGQNSDEWTEWITEQALRENYCKPFEIAVKVSINPGEDETDPNKGKLMKNVKVSYDAEKGELYTDPNGRPQTGANAMMSAFNCVGGIWAGYNHALLTDLLRTEWGFQGSVITDYGKQYMETYGRGLKAGNTLWMSDTGASAGINYNDPAEAYAARRALRENLYTYLDTLYTSGLETTVAAKKPFSPLFVGLWAGLDVLLGLGIAACVVFFFWSPLKNRKAKKAAAAEGAEGSPQNDVTDEPLQQAAPEENPPTPPDEA